MRTNADCTQSKQYLYRALRSYRALHSASHLSQALSQAKEPTHKFLQDLFNGKPKATFPLSFDETAAFDLPLNETVAFGLPLNELTRPLSSPLVPNSLSETRKIS